MPGRYNVIKEPLASREKVLLPLLHIKFKFEAICQSFGFQWRNINQSNVPKIVRCQTKARKICWSPKNNKLKLRTLQEKMTEREKKTWQAFREVVEVFLRKNKDPNY